MRQPPNTPGQSGDLGFPTKETGMSDKKKSVTLARKTVRKIKRGKK